MTTKVQSDYRIYVACLASYNNGVLYGKWIDADQSADDIEAEVKAMLRGSKFPNVMVDCQGDQTRDADEKCSTCDEKCAVPSAEEWAIHDYELDGIKIGEHESFERVSQLAAALDEHGEAFAAWWNYTDRDEVDVSDFEDEYQGQYRNFQEYAEEYVDSTGMLHGVSDTLVRYFDYEAFARDLEMDYTVLDAPNYGGVFVFNSY